MFSRSEKNAPKPEAKVKEPTIDSYLAEDIKIVGNIETKKSLRLDGSVIGDLKIDDCLVVGQKGNIEGNLEVGEIEIYGKILGNINCKGHISIFSSGTVDGDIETASLNIEAGGNLNGKCNMHNKPKQSPSLPDFDFDKKGEKQGI